MRTLEFEMKKQLFNELIESIREAGKIHRGEKAPSRRFAFQPEDVRSICATSRLPRAKQLKG